jgi:hypothetical protein
VIRKLALSVIMSVAASTYAHASVCVENKTVIGERRFIAALVEGTDLASLKAAHTHHVAIGDYFCGGTDGKTPLYLSVYFKPSLGEPENYSKTITIYVSSKSYTVKPNKSYSVQVEQNPDGTPKVTAIDSDEPTRQISVPMKRLSIPW